MLAASELAMWFGWDSYRLRGQQRAMVVAMGQSNATYAANFRPVVPAATDQTSATPADSPSPEALLLVTAGETPAATLEIFTDVMCPSCRTFEQTLLKDYVPLFQGRLNVVLRHFPLCSACNPGKSNLHPWACEAAYLVEAARRQKGSDVAIAFMHEIDPSRKSPLAPAELETLAARLGLDVAKLTQDAQSAVVKERIAADVKFGQASHLNATPSLFLDGRPVDPVVRNQAGFWQAAATRAGVAQPAIAAKSNEEPPVDAAVLLDSDPDKDRKLEVAKSILAMNDFDLDSVLNAAEAAKVYKDTSKIDLNKNGKIELAEIASGIRHIQQGTGSKDLTQVEPKPKVKSKTKEAPRPSTVFPGDVLPLSGPTLDGQQFDLAQWKGKPVIVAFWASWCSHCVDETAELKRLYQTYHDRGLEIVGISADRDAAQVEKFVQQNELPWPQLMSADPKTRGMRNPWSTLANVRALPSLFLIGADGKVADVHLRGRKIEMAVADAMNVEPAAEDVAAQESEKLKAALIRPVDSKHVSNPLQIGDSVMISGSTIDGGHFDVASLKGKAVLVAFWATWCPHCRKELPKLMNLHNRYRDRGLEIVGISLDRNSDDLQTYLGGQPLPWPTIFMDQEGLRHFNNPLAYWFGVKGIPALFLLDQEGRIAALKPRGADLEAEVAKLLGQAPPATATKTDETAAAAEPPPATANPPKAVAKAAAPPALLADAAKLRNAAAVMIKRYDTNQDEVLVPEEWSKSKVDYGRFDGDKDGRLTVDEMVSAVQLVQRFKAVQASQKKSQPPVPVPEAAIVP